MVLTLYGLDASPPVRAVKTVINKLNISNVEYVNVNILNGEQNKASYLKINPQHSIPTLKDDDFIIWDRFPNLVAWLKRCSEQSFIKEANEKGLNLFSGVLKSKLG